MLFKQAMIYGLFFLMSHAFSLFATPAQVILIRHAEKPSEGPMLNLKGYERAAALAPMFMGDPRVTQFGTPIALYAQSALKPESSVRAMQTLHPLSMIINVPINKNFHRDNYASAAKEILTSPAYNGKLVIVAWEHKVIPLFAQALGANTAPSHWPGYDVYDRLWILTYTTNGVTFQDFPQQLLYGDSPN